MTDTTNTTITAITRVSPEQALQHMRDDGYAYLDVRSEQEFSLGHPEGAYNIALKHMGAQGMVDNPDFLAIAQSAFAKDAKLVVGCRSGRRSMQAAQLLIDAGFTQVIEQRAGFEGPKDAFGSTQEKGWQACGLPCAMEPLPGRSHGELCGG